jgi:hypothetical protein
MKKANSILGFTRRNLRHCHSSLKETAYHWQVRSILDYSAVVWDPFLKDDTSTTSKTSKDEQPVNNDYRRDYRRDISVTRWLRNWNGNHVQNAEETSDFAYSTNREQPSNDARWPEHCILSLTSQKQTHKNHNQTKVQYRHIYKLILPTYNKGLEYSQRLWSKQYFARNLQKSISPNFDLHLFCVRYIHRVILLKFWVTSSIHTDADYTCNWIKLL